MDTLFHFSSYLFKRRRKQYSPSLLRLILGFGGMYGLRAGLGLPLSSLSTRYNVTDL
jgi:hypothetical protein